VTTHRLSQHLTKKPAEKIGRLVQMTLQKKVASVEEVHLGTGTVVGECGGACWPENLIVPAPDGQHRNLTLSQVRVEGRIERWIGGVVTKELQLDQIVPRS
jgi:hypothetical protein